MKTELNIQIKPDTASDTIISFAAPLLTRYQIGDIRPQPDKMYSADGKITSRLSAVEPPFTDICVVSRYPKNGR
ncbi:Uncharacterised protein [Klebsiella pneumoniae]|uniref:Uncharacterized protein n=1 Tax=Klebsiella pneumoniae TaxID=573 RepID=A0A2X3E654_KLEPN|nr:Uncharacterised protein [Klebsiella pneumoniae]